MALSTSSSPVLLDRARKCQTKSTGVVQAHIKTTGTTQLLAEANQSQLVHRRSIRPSTKSAQFTKRGWICGCTPSDMTAAQSVASQSGAAFHVQPQLCTIVHCTPAQKRCRPVRSSAHSKVSYERGSDASSPAQTDAWGVQQLQDRRHILTAAGRDCGPILLPSIEVLRF